MRPRLLVLSAVLGSVVLAAAAAPATAAPSAPTGTVVTGRVTDRAGHPLTAVQVVVAPLDTDYPPTVVAATRTDGAYRIVLATGIGPSKIQFWGGHATGGDSAGGYLDATAQDAAGHDRVVTPHAGGTAAGVGATLAPAAGAHGRVTSDRGAPLAGVLVQVAPDGPFDVSQAFRVVRTDAAGRWTFTGLDLLGADTLRATVWFDTTDASGGTSPTGYATACLGLVAVPCSSRDFTGPDGQFVTLTAGTSTIANQALPPAAVLRGRVTDAAGAPIAGASVNVFDGVSSRITGQPTPVQGPSITTAADGTWTAEHLLPQRYQVCYGWYGDTGTGANPDGYVAECSHNSPRSAGPFAGVAYRVTSGQTVAVTDSLTANGAVSGRVVDQNGAPVLAASVRIGFLDATGEFLPVVATGRSARDGTFTVHRAPPGRPVICGHFQHATDVCPPAGGTPQTVAVRPGATTTGVTVVLHVVG